MAQLSTGNREDALDLVQEAMLRFAKAYARRPLEQWPPLFHRVLQNRIRDWHRRQGARRRIFGFFVQSEDDETDPINAIPDATNPDPVALALGDNTARTLMKTLKTLPHRQRQAFLLRVWEGFDVTSTATAMACSEGSVKTHLSRAMSRVRAALQDEADE
ncbi:MAG: RNA polymerase sigma factor [Gammaproteobacteria bacterium]|nr:RNA polymerase sigma factor [Gammaproteobacteria bacterium]